MSDFQEYGAKLEPYDCILCGDEILGEEFSCQFCFVDLHPQCVDGHIEKEHEGMLIKEGYYDLS